MGYIGMLSELTNIRKTCLDWRQPWSYQFKHDVSSKPVAYSRNETGKKSGGEKFVCREACESVCVKSAYETSELPLTPQFFGDIAGEGNATFVLGSL